MSFHGYTLETSVPVMLLFLVVLYAVVRLVVRLFRMPRNIGRAATAFRARRARDHLARGLLALDMGDWARGEQLLGRSAHDGEKPILHYLGAARAAQEQGATDRRDRWLALAGEQKSEGETAVLLARAEMRMTEAQYASALETLHELESIAPDQPRAPHCAQASAALETGAASSPRPGCKLRALSAGAIDDLERRAQQTRCSAPPKAMPSARARHVRGLGRDLTGRIELQRPCESAGGCGRRARCGGSDPSGAEVQLGRRAGAALRSTRAIRRNSSASKRLPTSGRCPLLIAAARLCMRNELWGKARSYLEASLSLSPNVQAYQLYGKLLDQLGERDRAADAFRSGLALATGRPGALPALPMPKA